MQLNSLRTTALLSLSLGAILIGTTTCQEPSASQAPDSKAPGSSSGAAGNAQDGDGLPTFLLKVPAGDVLMGMEVDAFVDACSQAAYPYDPKNAYKQAEEKFITTMRRSSSVLGRKQVTVPEFYLGKWPVKNSEYVVHVERLRAANDKIRPPFHWWRYGCEDDYNKRLDEIRKAFPNDKDGPVLFWEREGHTLPFKVQDAKGKSIADLPVVYITWREANRFAASIGMRLPTEAELTRAMRGDGSHTWPGGEAGPEKDKFNAAMLKLLKMYSTSEQVGKPVGSVPGAIGPFGHLDMFGQVWQFVGETGYNPIHNDMAGYLKQWDLLMKHKTGRMCNGKPLYAAQKVIAKGGSYLSFQEPVQLMIDARAPMGTTDCLESLGLRLAKSIAPGYDFLYSMQRVAFDSSAFAKDQELDFAALVGKEHYTLAANGFPSNYEAVAFAPVNWLSPDKNAKVRNLLEESMERPHLIGALATTAKLSDGTAPGLYSVFYRAEGISKELRDAIKAGHKEVSRARKEEEKRAKAAEKSGKKDETEEDATKEEAVRKWRIVTKRFGLTDDDLADPKAADGDCGYVVIDGVKIPTDRDAFILASGGRMVAVIEDTKNNKKPSAAQAEPGTVEIEAFAKGKTDKSVVKFHIGIPLIGSKPKNVVVFDLHVVLDQAVPTADQPWR